MALDDLLLENSRKRHLADKLRHIAGPPIEDKTQNSSREYLMSSEEYLEKQERIKEEQKLQDAALQTNQLTVLALVRETNIFKKRNYKLLDQIKETENCGRSCVTAGSETFMAEVSMSYVSKK